VLEALGCHNAAVPRGVCAIFALPHSTTLGETIIYLCLFYRCPDAEIFNCRLKAKFESMTFCSGPDAFAAKIPVRQPDYANLPSLNLAKNVSATFILVEGNSTQHKKEHNSKKTFCLLSEKRTRSKGHKEIGIVRGEVTKSQAK